MSRPETSPERAADDQVDRPLRLMVGMFERNVVAMQAALIEAHLSGPERGLVWILNTLDGPGLLPDVDEARAAGGAQAWFDREFAKVDATLESTVEAARLFRAAPALLAALRGIVSARALYNDALHDGINVHGAMSAMLAAEDAADAAIAAATGSAA